MKHNGKLLNAMILKKRLVKKEVAEKMDITPVYLSKMFNMETFNTAQLEKVCSVIGEDPAQFFDYRGEQEVGVSQMVGDMSASSIIGSAEIHTHLNAGQSENNESRYLLEKLLEEKERIIILKDRLLDEKDKIIKMLLDNQQRYYRKPSVNKRETEIEESAELTDV